MSSSPPIARVVAVLNFLGGHAGQAFTLTEIAKSLRISGATCHSLLSALAEAGYVYRTAAKSYVIGPALSQIAQPRLTMQTLMQVVRPEMRLLADEFDVVCSASFLEGEDVIVHERAASVSNIAWNANALTAHKATAPAGSVFMAWSSSEIIERWLERAEPPLDATGREAALRTVEFLRRNGFTFGVRLAPLDSPEHALALQSRRDMTDYSVAELKPGASYNLAFISVPIFGCGGEVAFSLNLLGFSHPAKGEEIAAMSDRLRAACGRISAFIAGRELVRTDALSGATILQK
jgi:DNA-binding IclR family transcriptional regulator